MSDKIKYHTRTNDQILEQARTFKTGFTAKDLNLALAKHHQSFGFATIYRHLDELTDAGIFKKSYDDNHAATYYYIESCEEKNHFYLKCRKCQKIFHVDCHEIAAFTEHVDQDHHFSIEFNDIILSGICEKCQGAND